MKKIIYVLIGVFMAFQVLAQYRVTDGAGKTVTYAGNTVKSVGISGGGDTEPGPDPDPADTIRYICGIGDDVMHDSYDEMNDLDDYNVNNIANSGDIIMEQLADWNALSTEIRDSFDYVIIHVGVNDIADGNNYATLVSRYQSLISAIHGDIQSSCKILMYTMTPCKGRTGISDSEVTTLKSVNTWIDGIPTNVDYASTKNWDDLTDGNDSIQATYNLNRDYLHLNSSGESVAVTNMTEDIEILYNNGWEILFTLNFDDWDQHPNGLHEDTIEDYVGTSHFAFLGSENDDHADDVAILNIDGSNVLRSYYDEGNCCVESDSAGGVGNGGTGINLELWITAAGTGYEHIGMFWNEYFQDIFAFPEGMKQPGPNSSPGSGASYTIAMLVEDAADTWGGGDSINLQVYDGLYPSAESNEATNTGNKHLRPDSLVKDAWQNVGHMVYRGDDDVNNFNHHMYLRGDYIGFEKSGYYYDTDHTSAGGWAVKSTSGISISTFMGGNINDYNSPWDQWMDIDDMFVGIPILDGLAVWEGQYDSVSDEPDDGFEIPLPPCANWNQTTKDRN